MDQESGALSLPGRAFSMDRAAFGNPALWTVACFAIITGLVHIHMTGDAPEYVGAVYARIHDRVVQTGFWDAGHLLWRPAGYVATLVQLKITGQPAESITWALVANVFIGLSLLGGLACAVFTPLWLRQLGCRPTACVVASLILIASNAFLDYYSGGTAYSTATGALVLGLYLLSLDEDSTASAIGAGVSLALAVLVWLPFVLALPGAFASSVLSGSRARQSAGRLLVCIASCALVGLGVYAAVLVELRIHSLSAAVGWITSASHGVSSIFGVPRMAIGFARSFVNIGADGAALKRFVLHDPLNPVTIPDLLELGLWKIALFYGVLGVIVFQLLRLGANARFIVCLLFAIPVLGFAVAWQGGDTERYLAFYPAFLLAYATVVSDARTSNGTRTLLYAFTALCALVNVNAHSRWAFAAEENDVVQRTSAFDANLLPAPSIVVVPTLVDRTTAYFLSGAQDTSRIRATLQFYPLIQQGAASQAWRQQFAEKALAVWRSGGRVWLSKRVLAGKPKVDWGWAEGEDRGISWSDFPRFFSALELRGDVGGNDGFVELTPSPENEARLTALAISPTAR